MKINAPYKPNTVQVELVQGCNRRCEFCGTLGIEHKVHFIDAKTLRKECILIRDSGVKPRILIAMHGEPTLHPEFYSCIKLIRKILPDLYIKLLSNGYLLKKDRDFIVKAFASGINDISIDEYSDSRFDYAVLKKRCDKYERLSGEKVIFSVYEGTEQFYGPKRKKYRRFMIIPPIDESQVKITRKLVNHCGAGSPKNDVAIHKRCAKPFREIAFRWDGNVAICCNDFRGEFPVISCHDVDDLNQIWMHERFESARKILMNGGRMFYPCNVCDAISMRVGLLPDPAGKYVLSEPEKHDYKICEKKEPYSKIVKRSYENDS